MSNPYESPGGVPDIQTEQVGYGSASSGGPSVMAPLHEAAFFIQFVAWFNIVAGVIYALTIIGIIFAWLPIWMGICLKNAGDSLKVAERTGDRAQYVRAASNISTFFKIIGVLFIINTVILALYLLAIIGMMVLGLVGAAAMSGS